MGFNSGFKGLTYIFFSDPPLKNVSKDDKIVIHHSLEMPFSRRSLAEKLRIMKDR